MACERYTDRLEDAALGALDPARDAELSAHVSTCRECRAGLERERLLVAAMEQGIVASVAGDPSPEFVARLRRRLAEEAARPRFGFAGWVPVAVPVVALAALAIVLLAPRPSRPPANSAKTREPAETGRAERAASPLSPGARNEHPAVRKGLRKATPRRGPNVGNEPEVVVEKGEWDAVVKFYDAVWNRRVDASTVARGTQAGDIPGPKPLEVAPLEIAMLDSGSGPAEEVDHR